MSEFNLPLHARVWVYQSSRKFTADEEKKIALATDNFLDQWHSHGKELSAEIRLLHGIFLIIAVDEQQAMASGCSIDKSVRLIKDLENELGVSLTGRTTVAYYSEKDVISFMNYQDLRHAIQTGNISDRVLIFNNLISTLDDLMHNWVIPACDSWLMNVRV